MDCVSDLDSRTGVDERGDLVCGFFSLNSTSSTFSFPICESDNLFGCRFCGGCNGDCGRLETGSLSVPLKNNSYSYKESRTKGHTVHVTDRQRTKREHSGVYHK